MHVQFNIPSDNNNRPTDMSTTHPPPLTTTSCIHLRPHINQKPNLHGAGQGKYSHPYHKFQTGSTTTLSGYINVCG